MDENSENIEKHNELALLELVENFDYVEMFLIDARSIIIKKEDNFKFENGKFFIDFKDNDKTSFSVAIGDIDLIEVSD